MKRDSEGLGVRPSPSASKSLPIKGPAERPSARALTSWKEIAQHLGVNVRTAQRWERESGLPVQRAQGLRGRVSADIGSIQEWKDRRARVVQELHAFSWPLGPGLNVEIRFVGRAVKPADIALLRDYLRLVRTSLTRTDLNGDV